MLVLTRKLNEQIRIGDDVTITVLRVKGNTIRLGIEAPRATRIVRGELKPLDQEHKSESTPTASQPQLSAPKRASSDGTPTPTPDDPAASPLGAFMPAKQSYLTADLTV